MSRVIQPQSQRGSQKWLQEAVNNAPASLDNLILPSIPEAGAIRWLSPRATDDYAEYRDADFLKLIGAAHLADQLADFWPTRGPQWDALAVSDHDVLLVEAKAHIGELCSPGTAAGSESLVQIEKALAETSKFIGATPRASWSQMFYQLANRISHLYFLRKHGIRAWLVLINFVGDTDVKGPSTEEAWRTAYQVAWHVLGVPKHHRLADFIVEIFPQVRQRNLD